MLKWFLNSPETWGTGLVFQPARSEVPTTEHFDGRNIWWSLDQCLQVRTYLL